MMRSCLLAVCMLSASAAWASEPDPTTLYVVTTEGSSSSFKAGKPGTLVLFIKTLPGAHISEDAPLKISLTGSGGIEPAKFLLNRTDATLVKKPDGAVDPRFVIPLLAAAKGHGAVEAKLTFFVCTETLCSRQQKTVSVPVTVD